MLLLVPMQQLLVGPRLHRELVLRLLPLAGGVGLGLLNHLLRRTLTLRQLVDQLLQIGPRGLFPLRLRLTLGLELRLRVLDAF